MSEILPPRHNEAIFDRRKMPRAEMVARAHVGLSPQRLCAPPKIGDRKAAMFDQGFKILEIGKVSKV